MLPFVTGALLLTIRRDVRSMGITHKTQRFHPKIHCIYHKTVHGQLNIQTRTKKTQTLLPKLSKQTEDVYKSFRTTYLPIHEYL